MKKEKLNKFRKELKKKYDDMTPEHKVIVGLVSGLILGTALGLLITRRR